MTRQSAYTVLMMAAKVLQNVQQLRMSMNILSCNNSKILMRILTKMMIVKIVMNKMHRKTKMQTSRKKMKTLIVNLLQKWMKSSKNSLT